MASQVDSRAKCVLLNLPHEVKPNGLSFGSLVVNHSWRDEEEEGRHSNRCASHCTNSNTDTWMAACAVTRGIPCDK